MESDGRSKGKEESCSWKNCASSERRIPHREGEVSFKEQSVGCGGRKEEGQETKCVCACLLTVVA